MIRAVAIAVVAVAALGAASTSSAMPVPTPDPAPAVQRPTKVERLLKIARTYLGVRYVWGGTTRAGVDCSGFIQAIFRRVGIRLPRTTWSQIRAGRSVSLRWKRRGDIVFSSGGGHVSLYIGRNRIIHAPYTGTVVRIDRLTGRSIVAVRRILR